MISVKSTGAFCMFDICNHGEILASVEMDKISIPDPDKFNKEIDNLSTGLKEVIVSHARMGKEEKYLARAILDKEYTTGLHRVIYDAIKKRNFLNMRHNGRKLNKRDIITEILYKSGKECE